MTSTADQSDRHLTLENLDRLWRAGRDMVVPIPGTPPCRLRLRPATGYLGLVLPYTSPEPDVVRLRNIDILTFVDGGDENLEIRIQTSADGVHAAYGLLTSVADQVQLQQRPVAAAFEKALEANRGMVAQRGALSPEKEIGLFGELQFFGFLVAELGAAAALEAWVGPLSEEHDFVLPELHIEVKTTSAERRRHVIGSLQQLLPLHGVPLYVMSTQLTVSSGSGGQTLPRLVAETRAAVGGHLKALDERLTAGGWEDEHAPLYRTVWAERATPRAYLVDDDFPVIDPTKLAGITAHFEVVSDVRYRIDLTDRPHSALPAPLGGYIDGPKGDA